MSAARVFSELIHAALYFPLFTAAANLKATWMALICALAFYQARADDFVSGTDAQGRGNGGSQKAILLYDDGREDLILQAAYEGPGQDFGWLIAVPGPPEIRQGSIQSFFDLSRFTQEPLWPEEFDHDSLVSSFGNVNRIKAINIQTIGAYEATLISARDTTAISEWLATNGFAVPTEKKSLLQDYANRGWHFVAVRVDPAAEGSAVKPRRGPARRGLGIKREITGELTPLVISFPSEKCIYPLALSTANVKPGEISLFVFSSEPLISRAIFTRNYAGYLEEREKWISQRPAREQAHFASTNRSIQIELAGPSRRPGLYDDPADPRPLPEVLLSLHATSGPLGAFSESDDDFYGGGQLIRCLEADTKDLPECAKILPRLVGKKWWLTKQILMFAAEGISDLEFEPALPILAEKLHTPEGRTLARRLPQFGQFAVPVVLEGLKSSEPAEAQLALSAMAQMADPRLVQPVAQFLVDPDPRTRANACAAARLNWDSAFAPRLLELLSDNSAEVRSAACSCLQEHEAESARFIRIYRRMVDEGGVAAWSAMALLRHHHEELPMHSLAALFSSDDPCTIKMAIWDLHDRIPSLDEISPLLTNSLPMARLNGLVLLLHRGDKAAMDRIVSMLRDPDEGLRWTVRTNLRRLSGRKLGADPAAWEKWWAENRETFTPAPPPKPPFLNK